MNEYEISTEEEKELKSVHDAFEKSNIIHSKPPHNDAPFFDISEHEERAKESSYLIDNMWSHMKQIFEDKK